MPKDTEQLILDTARKHFVLNGYAGTRMQDIADEAGINKAMLHYYFRTKDKMYRQIFIQILNEFIPKIAKAMSFDGSFWEKTEHIVDTYITTLVEKPEIPFFIMSEISQKRERFVEELKKRASFFPAIQSFLLEMMKEMEEGRIKNVAPNHLLLNLIGMTVFPFMAKPVFRTIFDVTEDDFQELMKERKTIIIDFMRSALTIE